MSVISKEYATIYFRVPKTGSRSINKVLKENGFHENRDKWPDHNDYGFSFTFVRNPWDRLVSRYCHLRRRIVEIQDGTEMTDSPQDKNLQAYFQGEPISLDKFNFKDFVSFTKRVKNKHWAVQCTLFPEWTSFIGRFENMQKDFDVVCNRIGMTRCQLPHSNSTEHAHYSSFYDDELRDEVADIYKQDIERFGYKFENKTMKTFERTKILGHDFHQRVNRFKSRIRTYFKRVLKHIKERPNDQTGHMTDEEHYLRSQKTFKDKLFGCELRCCPRTGSTLVAQVVREAFPQLGLRTHGKHDSFDVCPQLVPHTLITIRNPYAWIVSRYSWSKQRSTKGSSLDEYTVGKDMVPDACIDDLCHTYSKYYGGWLSKGKGVTVIRHEDILAIGIDAILKPLEDHFGIKRAEGTALPTIEVIPVTCHSREVHEYDESYYTEHKYLDCLTPDQIDRITELIDWPTFEGLYKQKEFLRK